MAYILIACAVLVYSLYPAAMLQFVSPKIDILSYLFLFHLVAATARITMAKYYNTQVLSKRSGVSLRIWDDRIIKKETIQLGILNAILDILGFGCFFFALYFGNVVQASVFYELWASIFLIFTIFFRKNQPGEFHHQHGRLVSGIFFVIGVVGIVLVVSSNNSSGTLLVLNLNNNFDLLVLLSAILSPVFMAMSFFVGTKNARLISALLRTEIKNDGVISSDKAVKGSDLLAGIYHGVFLRVAGIFVLIFTMILLYLVGVWEPNIEISNGWAVVGVLFCALMATSGGALADISNNLSKTSNLNQFWSFTPFLAVVFLNLFGFADDASKELYFGAILILAANYIILSKNNYSKSFIASVLGLCTIYFVILFVPPIQSVTGFHHVTVSLGIFGIFAAFFIDRIMKKYEERTANSQEKKSTGNISLNTDSLFSHNIFILWILGFGSIFGMVFFRPENSMATDFVAAFVSVAVIYICLLPIEYLVQISSRNIAQPSETRNNSQISILSLFMSGLFIAFLFVLYLFALLG